MNAYVNGPELHLGDHFCRRSRHNGAKPASRTDLSARSVEHRSHAVQLDFISIQTAVASAVPVTISRLETLSTIDALSSNVLSEAHKRGPLPRHGTKSSRLHEAMGMIQSRKNLKDTSCLSAPEHLLLEVNTKGLREPRFLKPRAPTGSTVVCCPRTCLCWRPDHDPWGMMLPMRPLAWYQTTG